MPSTFSSWATVSEACVLVVGEAGQAQVEHLDHALRVDQQVGGLDVAVDQAGLVGVLQAVGRLADVVGRRFVAAAGRRA